MYRVADIEIDGGPHLKCLVGADLAIHVGDSGIVECSRALEYGLVHSLNEAEGDAPAAEVDGKFMSAFVRARKPNA